MKLRVTNILQASCGSHVFGTRPKTDAALHFAGRERLGPGECLVCNEDRRVVLRRDARLCDCYDEICNGGCAYLHDLEEIVDPPDGLVYIDDNDHVEIIS